MGLIVCLVAGSATYRDYEVEGSTTPFDAEHDTTFGLQAFVDMTVSRKWAVNLGLKYLDTQVEFGNTASLDFDPVTLRVMGVYRWGRRK